MKWWLFEHKAQWQHLIWKPSWLPHWTSAGVCIDEYAGHRDELSWSSQQSGLRFHYSGQLITQGVSLDIFSFTIFRPHLTIVIKNLGIRTTDKGMEKSTVSLREQNNSRKKLAIWTGLWRWRATDCLVDLRTVKTVRCGKTSLQITLSEINTALPALFCYYRQLHKKYAEGQVR